MDPRSFANVPRSPFAYWVMRLRCALFTRLRCIRGVERSTARWGPDNLDDFRLSRLVGSRRCAGGDVHPFAKGGRIGRFYADVYLVVAGLRAGSELKDVRVTVGRASASKTFRTDSILLPPRASPGLAGPGRTVGCGRCQRECIFGSKGPAAFVEDDCRKVLLALLAIFKRIFGPPRASFDATDVAFW